LCCLILSPNNSYWVFSVVKKFISVYMYNPYAFFVAIIIMTIPISISFLTVLSNQIISHIQIEAFYSENSIYAITKK
jgi:hypothetical protein